MHLYGADHHLLILSDTIDAEVHQHSFLQVTLSLQSDFEMEIEGNTVRCAGIVIDSHVNHRLNGDGQPLLLLLIDSTSNLARSFKKLINGSNYYQFPKDRLENTALFVQSHYLNIEDSDSYHHFLVQFLDQLGTKYLQPETIDPRIAQFIDHLKNCNEHEHSVDSYASQVHLSSSRLSHLFKQNTGISLSGYIVLHKLQKAIYLIFNGQSITDAALAAGFDSPSHLAATSKRLLGMAAKDIRKDSSFLKVSCLL
ncbi:AraC family transcriptional regulator [Paenibacillus sp. IITD108]|uniref:AraC family transcriptional regulator n=1 Tax=Paenibacillus sp. IITD108 TaxID=3116649 RepID=UPI002F41F64F